MLESASPEIIAERAGAGAREAVAERAGPAAGGARKAVIGTATVIAALAALNALDHFAHYSGLLVAPIAAAVLLGFARLHGLTWEQLGLGRSRVRAGLLWGAGAIAVVAAIYLVGVLVPAFRPAFLDVRYHLALPGAAMSAFVVIPVGTILIEEIAFRSVLWGMLSRHMAAWRVLLTSSLLFGLWHVLPSLHLASANHGVGETFRGAGASANVLAVLAAVAFTALGGIVAGELRRRSGSLLASAGMHWATNALGVLFGLVAWKLAG